MLLSEKSPKKRRSRAKPKDKNLPPSYERYLLVTDKGAPVTYKELPFPTPEHLLRDLEVSYSTLEELLKDLTQRSKSTNSLWIECLLMGVLDMRVVLQTTTFKNLKLFNPPEVKS